MLEAGVLGSAAVPALLLARSVTGRWWAAAAAAAACVALPWTLLEPPGRPGPVAYVAFLWALLALYRAVAAPSAANDGLALAAIALASLAHGQLVLLLAALPAALLLHEGRQALSGHRLLAVVYPVLLLVALLALAGVVDEALGWKWRVVRESLQPAVARATLEHLAWLAWSLAVVPFLVGVGWLLAALRGKEERRRHAYASLAVPLLVLVVAAATALDVLFAGEVRGRYLVYAVPLVVGALAAALVPLRRPAWSLLAAVLTSLGLGLGLSRITGRINDWFVRRTSCSTSGWRSASRGRGRSSRTSAGSRSRASTSCTPC